MGVIKRIRIRAQARRVARQWQWVRGRDVVPLCGLEPFQFIGIGPSAYTGVVARGEKACPVVVMACSLEDAKREVRTVVSARGYRGYSTNARPMVS